MANSGQNEGFRVLDDFACEAIRDPSFPPASPARQGQNEGARMSQELLLDSPETPPEGEAAESGKETGPHESAVDS